MVLAVLALVAGATAGAAENFTVETRRVNGAVEVRVRAVLAARYDTIWATLTDYDNLARFVPGFRVSRVIERRPRSAVVHQQGEAGFLFVSIPIDVVVESYVVSTWELGIRLLSGNLRRLEGAYRIDPVAGRARPTFVLRWSGLIEPEDGLPPLFGETVAGIIIEDQFRGMVIEIERRAALGANASGGHERPATTH